MALSKKGVLEVLPALPALAGTAIDLDPLNAQVPWRLDLAGLLVRSRPRSLGNRPWLGQVVFHRVLAGRLRLPGHRGLAGPPGLIKHPICFIPTRPQS